MLDVAKEFEHIRPLVSADTTPEQLYIFSIKMCNSEIDSDFDKLTPAFLQQFSDFITASPIPLIKDHNWTAENQIGRVYRAEVLSDGLDSQGESYTYVLGYAYVAANSEIVSRLKLGLLSEVSVGFDGKGYTCSVCGADVLSHDSQCPNGHIFGSTIEGVTVYRSVGECTSALECSFVPVPAQDGAEVQSKSKEVKKVKRSEFFKKLGLKSKKAEEEESTAVAAETTPATADEETKSADETEATAEETKAEETGTEETEEDGEVTIDDLVAEIAALKQAVAELQSVKATETPEENASTKARTQYVKEQPAIKARVSQAGSISTTVKSRTPYATERTL
jgi:hypothetical protein